MRIAVIGTESLGVRGLSCVVELEDCKIVIDPGVAVGEQVRRRILAELGDATDVVMSHCHGDHIPLLTTIPETLRTDPSSRKED